MLGVNKASPSLSKNLKVYWLSHLPKNPNVPVRSQKKRTFANQTSQNEISQFWTSKCQPAQSGGVFKRMFYKENTEAREKMDTERMDEWSLERMKKQDPRRERVERTFW